MKKIALIGAGGINSWVAMHLFDVVKLFEQSHLIYVKIFDEDIVEEKNIVKSNQNFNVDDLMMPKAETLAKRYKFDFENIFITEENIHLLDNFDDIILGVDNHKTRKLVYQYCYDNKKYLLDLRANGTKIAFFVLEPGKTKDWSYYIKEHFTNIDIMERKGSCQLEEDIQTGHIESGNKIIAYMGVWGLYLKRIRKEEITTYEYRFVY